MFEQAISLYREHNKRVFDIDKKFDKNDVEFDFSEKSSIYNSIEDGISILDKDLNVLSINFTFRTWYPNRKSFTGKKCYYVYHNRKEPCDVCPILKTLKDGKAHCDIVPYIIKSKNITRWHEIKSYPIVENDLIVGIVEYVKDITSELDMYYKIYKIQNSLNDVKEQNDVVKDFLDQIDKTRNEISKNISENIRKFVNPLIKQLKNKSIENPPDYQLVCLLHTLLENITTPFLEESTHLEEFTSQEIQVMSMIKGGKTSKEIADLMSLSTKTIDFHRANIRKKLDLKRTDNLRAFLVQSLMSIESI